MSTKTIVTIILLLFVGVSVAYVVVSETRGNPEPASGDSAVAPPDLRQSESLTPPNGDAAQKKVLAYYFHGNARCMTCRTIEAYAQEAIQTAFPDALGSRQLEWRVVNVEAPGNEHFVQDFQLSTRSVVLVKLVDGRPGEWKNLQKVWELVGDKVGFQRYIRDETQAYLTSAR